MEKNIEKDIPRDNVKELIKSNPVSQKLFIIAILTLILVIPSTFILSLINERKKLGDNALIEVSSKWGKEQNIGGPVLYVPFVKEWTNSNSETLKRVDYIKILPKLLNVSGSLDPEVRYRGIYKFILYSSKLNFKGNFEIPNLDDLDLTDGTIKWEDSYILFGVSDMIGIKDNIKINWNKEENYFNPGLKSKDIFSSGVNVNVKVKPNEKNEFEFDLNVRGSEKITFIPFGKETKVNLSSNWGHPKFIGGFLPDEREITNDKFKAKWKVLDLNRNFPQKWMGNIEKKDIFSSSFGVDFLVPIDEYKQTMRAVKYIIMFVGLTFIIFFFVEILNRRKIHPIQYLLVEFSLVLFYLLLLSISEHSNFIFAYIISTISVVLLISLYSISVLGSKKFAVYISIMLLLLYGFLYILLLNQDYSLLLGSLGLFIVLSLVMYLSRNINWYEINFDKNQNKLD